MNTDGMTTEQLADRLKLIGAAARAEKHEFAEDVRQGLQAQPKRLPCRYLYDERGSRLFEMISRLPEYYLTRAEREILRGHAGQVAAQFAGEFTLVELGSGNAAKTRLLIEAALRRHGRLRYLPMDISTTALTSSATPLLTNYPALDIIGIAAEYHDGLRALPAAADGPVLFAFLGSSIGNFERDEAPTFLQRISAMLKPTDRLLVGIDLRKDRATLERAYDDAQGITARFNLNLLRRINRELGGTFDLHQFTHRARYDETAGRIEMHLVSRAAQEVAVMDLPAQFTFAAGETIHTENAYKYSPAEMTALLAAAGLVAEQRWLDAAQRYCLTLAKPERSRHVALG